MQEPAGRHIGDIAGRESGVFKHLGLQSDMVHKPGWRGTLVHVASVGQLRDNSGVAAK